MKTPDENVAIVAQFEAYLSQEDFPCVAARAAVTRKQVKSIIAENMACPKDDRMILDFLYDFVDEYRASGEMFYSAAVIFKGPDNTREAMFDALLWERLQSLSNIDAKNYPYDQRVSGDPTSKDFSFSLKEEAFFVVGLHPASSRLMRQFAYPVLVFNPHDQFEQLRQTRGYANMKNIIRKRDKAYSGSINPMLQDFGNSSEVYQYSGRKYDESWKCPLNIKHASRERYTTA
jgi:FPC/CPF motif-containing protein YcgG